MKKYLLAALLACASVLSGCITVEFEEEPPVDNVIEGGGEIVDSIEDKVEVKWEATDSRDVCIFLTNNATEAIPYVEGKVLYKDSEGKTIDIAEFYFNSVLAGSTVAHCAYAWDVTDEWETYEVTYTLNMDSDLGEKNHVAKCVVGSNVGDENIIVEIKNDSGVKLDEVEYVVVFYKEDQIVYAGYPEDRYEISIENGATYTGKVETRGNEYDRYEVYLNEALEW